MKITLIATILVALVLLSSVGYAMMPCPVNGKIVPAVGGVPIEVIHARTGLIGTGSTNENGIFVITQPSGADLPCSGGDVLVARYGSLTFTTIVDRIENIGDFGTLDITGEVVPCPGCADCPVEECPELNCQDCAEGGVYITDAEFKEYQDLKDSQEPVTIDSLWQIVIGLLVGGGGVFIYVTQGGKIKLNKHQIQKIIDAMPRGCGIRIFKSYTGKSDIKHFHRSPKNWHLWPNGHKEKYDHNGEENLFPDLE